MLFSAHGVPESYIEAGDPYLRHTEECVRLISKDVADQLCNDLTRPASMSKALGLQLAGSSLGTRTGVEVGVRAEAGSGTGAGSNTAAPAVQFHLSFQSRVGPVQWLK